jgi:hypothetical protein
MREWEVTVGSYLAQIENAGRNGARPSPGTGHWDIRQLIAATIT